ncbi:MAG: hypothetical protein DHS20C19_29710 [Acidimicrobiales bacterium]|nr:MAG: hypothetical protein DHS20C19_29710 [Acidimicrobiales bacterium]
MTNVTYAPGVPSTPVPAPVRRVLVVMAMELEAAPLRGALGAVDVAPPEWAAALPSRLAVAPATASRPEVLLAVNGTDPLTGVPCIGTTAAALTTQVALAAGPTPDLVLTVGTCGGWARAGASIGTTYLAWPHFSCHDRRIDLPGFQAFADGDLAAADLRSHASALGCELGIVTTGDSLDESPTDRERILANGGVAKEMEAAAVAWIAHLHGIPVGGVKSVTDLVDADEPTAAQFTANLEAASSALQSTTLALLHRLAGPE